MPKSKYTTDKQNLLNSIPYIVLAIIVSSLINITPEPGDDMIINFLLGIILRSVATMGAIMVVLFLMRIGGQK